MWLYFFTCLIYNYAFKQPHENKMNNLIAVDKPKDRSLFLNTQVDQDSVGKLIKEIIEINEHDQMLIELHRLNNMIYSPAAIKLYISSYGGSVYQGLGLMAAIESSVTPVHTIATGCAMSMGFAILIMGHKRFIHKHSTIMYHEASSFSYGKITEMETEMLQDKKMQRKIERIIVSKTNITKQQLNKHNKEKHDWFLTPKKALKLGIVDAIID